MEQIDRSEIEISKVYQNIHNMISLPDLNKHHNDLNHGSNELTALLCQCSSDNFLDR